MKDRLMQEERRAQREAVIAYLNDMIDERDRQIAGIEADINRSAVFGPYSDSILTIDKYNESAALREELADVIHDRDLLWRELARLQDNDLTPGETVVAILLTACVAIIGLLILYVMLYR